MAAKKTHELIPLCHPLGLSKVGVEITPDETLPGVLVVARDERDRQDRRRDGGADRRRGRLPDDLRHAEGGRPRHAHRGRRAGREARRQERALEPRERIAMTEQKPLGVDEALARVLEHARPLGEPETVPLARALGRTLAEDLLARRTQPPVDVSAMDGYAVRHADFADAGGALAARWRKRRRPRLRGRAQARGMRPHLHRRARAGRRGYDPVAGRRHRRERADPRQRQPRAGPSHPRARGSIFRLDRRCCGRGRGSGRRKSRSPPPPITPSFPSRAVPASRSWPAVTNWSSRGGALVPTGSSAATISPWPASSNRPAASRSISASVGDDLSELKRGIARAREARADVLVTLGGASVGDHDLLRPALAGEGMTPGFWRIAMRPGKPLIFGRLDEAFVLGLPGNPVASYVCALLFLVPLLRALQGDPAAGEDKTEGALLGVDLPANKGRRDYLRATLSKDAAGAARRHAAAAAGLLAAERIGRRASAADPRDRRAPGQGRRALPDFAAALRVLGSIRPWTVATGATAATDDRGRLIAGTARTSSDPC